MDKRYKIVTSAIIGIMCFILTSVMFMQFKVVDNTNLTSIENMREAELKTEMTSWKNRFDETDKKLQEARETLNEYITNIETNQKSSETLEQELLIANMLLRKNKFKWTRNNNCFDRSNYRDARKRGTSR